MKKIVLDYSFKVSEAFKHFWNFFKFSFGPPFGSASEGYGPPFGFGSKYLNHSKGVFMRRK